MGDFMSKYIPNFLKSQEQIEKQREKARLRQRKHRETSPEYMRREAIRLDKRHHTLETWKLSPRNSVAVMWDGEATDGVHYDILQAHAEGRQWKLAPGRSIGLREALHWFKKIKREVCNKSSKKCIFVGYGTRYDWEMMILGEPSLSTQDKIDIARQAGRSYKAVRQADEPLEKWYPQLGASIYLGRKSQRILFPFQRGELTLHEKLEFQDIHTFFARSFVRALDMFRTAWKEQEATLEPLFKLIVAGKEARGDWEKHNFTPEMIEQYNSAELVMCEWLWKTVLTLCQSINIFPKSLAGPAPMARAAIERYGLRSHIKPSNYDTIEYQEGEWMRVCREAYKGGRIELMIQGIVKQWWEADLTSAYPAKFKMLPCLAHGKSRKANPEEIAEANQGHVPDNAICYIEWAMPIGAHFGAFPCRDRHGGIHYPLCGQGWHHAELVQVFQELDAGDWDIQDMWIWESSCKIEHPFEQMINDLFLERQRLLTEGNAAEYLIKLTLNSMYGILAQMAGFARIVDEDGKTVAYKSPKYTNLYGAGKITAATQAALMRVALPQHDKVIAFATDAVYSTEPLALPPEQITDDDHKELGKWVVVEGKEERYFIAPGIGISPSGKSKTRGFGAMPSYQELTAAYLSGKPMFTYHEQRFQNILKSKAGDTLKGCAGLFAIEERSLTLDAYGLRSKRDEGRGVVVLGTCRYIPPYIHQQGANQPYTRIADVGEHYLPEELGRPDEYAL
jgi:hypothetical protein